MLEDIIFKPDSSNDIIVVNLSVEVNEYNQSTPNIPENIDYDVVFCEIERSDGTFIDLDGDQLFSVLGLEDLYWLERTIINEYLIRG